MKTLELDLKKDVLIVDLPIDAKNVYMSGNSIIYNSNKSCIVKPINDDYEFICKGLELTEEIASELVEVDYSNFQSDDENYELKKNYVKDTFEFMSFEDSFISAIESKKFYWLENPIEIIERGEDTEHNRVLNQNEWQEAEEKTFRNPLIFIKNYVQ